VLPVVYVLYRKSLFRRACWSRARILGQSDADFREWLGSIVEGSGQEEIVLAAAFRRFAGQNLQ
jgi:hypothetical protein